MKGLRLFTLAGWCVAVGVFCADRQFGIAALAMVAGVLYFVSSGREG